MKNKFEFNKIISKPKKPNFTSEKAEKAEKDFNHILEENVFLGVSKGDILMDKEELIITLKKEIPDRISLVLEKVNESEDFLYHLSKNEILDKVLAVDSLFLFMGKLIAVDIASGNSSSLINKRNKMISFKNIYDKIGIDKAVVLRIRDEITEDLILDFFQKIEKDILTSDYSYCEFRYNDGDIDAQKDTLVFSEN